MTPRGSTGSLTECCRCPLRIDVQDTLRNRCRRRQRTRSSWPLGACLGGYEERAPTSGLTYRWAEERRCEVVLTSIVYMPWYFMTKTDGRTY